MKHVIQKFVLLTSEFEHLELCPAHSKFSKTISPMSIVIMKHLSNIYAYIKHVSFQFLMTILFFHAGNML